MSQPTLLGLPTELRLQILESILSPDSILDIHPKRISRLKTTRIQSVCSILQINSQIRSEARKTFYENVTFRIRDGMTREDVREWLDLDIHDGGLRKVVFYTKGRCTMFGLQPEFNYLLMLNGFYSCDYCHREVHFDSKQESDYGHGSGVVFADLCSNRAFGCVELSMDALKDIKGEGGSKDGLIEIFEVLERDNSSSAA